MRAACILIGFAILLPFCAAANPVRDEVMSGAGRCEAVADNRSWLDCFYGSAQPMRAALGLAPAPQAQVKLVAPADIHPGIFPGRKAPVVAARPRQDGFLAGLLGSTKPMVSDMPMADYRFASNRTFTVTLKNGEVYQQEESDLVFATWTRPPAGYRVTITASADKYILRVKGQPGVNFHVRRR